MPFTSQIHPRRMLNHVPQVKFSAAFADGSCSVFSLKKDDNIKTLCEWKEPHISGGKFIGMSLTAHAAFTCTSSGILRRNFLDLENSAVKSDSIRTDSASLPGRLSDWRISANWETFAYGGDEVDLSVWNTELAFKSHPTEFPQPSGLTKKRKRNDDLFPAEIWRARNVPNDNLGLRQPIRITAVTYISSSSAGHHLVTGTQLGDMRRYDTRAGRRPVSNWIGLGKMGGIMLIEKGMSENELFMSDNGSNLFSVDLRTGGILCGYKGISGAITSIATSPGGMVSTALDRYARVHSVFPPPERAGSHQERKGEVLDKTYLNSVPTVVVWDRRLSDKPSVSPHEQDDEVWNNMEHVS
ncbi:hypothetical protein M413DRAFT_98830 [Hebeloma cylindrosporum]|uniref:Ribosome biogenesis protein NSA1 n=1 Tax=Hebeloma cylindrosporum TaxID=76867 RepID=A0A0C3CKF2_HEBCY|nr:hypothetical protein M413DRAFT_98830 [Hebeloma cylindrosporum h7]